MTDRMTTRQVSERLGVGVPTITRWVKAGYIEAADKFPQTNGGYLFDPAEVERVAAQRGAA